MECPTQIIGVAGVQTFTVVTTSDFVNTGTHLLIVEADGSATSSGSVDLQNRATFAGSFFRRPYVFTTDRRGSLLDSLPTMFGGVAIADGAGNITGTLTRTTPALSATGVDLTGATYTASTPMAAEPLP